MSKQTVRRAAPGRLGATSPRVLAARRRARTVQFAAIGAVVAIVVGVLVAVSNRGGSDSGTSTDPAAFVLPLLSGTGDVSLVAYKGEPVVVNFFASWCTACRAELPLMADASRRVRGRVQFIEVDSVENGDGLAMARQYGAGAMLLARDVQGHQNSGLRDAVARSIQGLPITAIYDATGRLVHTKFGAFNAADLRAALRQYAGVTY